MMHCNLGKKLHAATGDMQMEVSFTAGQGEFISIYGASGAGKTSILRMLAGFFDADHGMISFDDEVWFDSSKKIKVAPQKRRIGFVFQDYALFPNMSVRENLLFALTPGDRSTIVDKLMEATGLEQMNNRRVQTLSGGQKQRVALARALVRKPELLLLDEPLSAIDHELRVKLQDILLNLHRSYRLITVLVSHDIPEIIRLSDKTIILQEGKIKKYGPPAELFFEPQQEKFFSVAGSVAGVEKKGNSCTVTVLTDRQVIKITSAANDLYDLLKGDAVSITTNEGSPAIVRKLLKDH